MPHSSCITVRNSPQLALAAVAEPRIHLDREYETNRLVLLLLPSKDNKQHALVNKKGW
jgi:hypothetical protein